MVRLRKEEINEDIDNTSDNTKPYIKIFFRTLSILLIIYVEISLFGPLPKSGEEKEIIISAGVEKYISSGGRTRSSHEGKTVSIYTNLTNEYSFDGGTPFRLQDTIIVCKNIFGKKVGIIHLRTNKFFNFDKQKPLLITLSIVTILYALLNLFGDYRVRFVFIFVSLFTLGLLILYWYS